MDTTFYVYRPLHVDCLSIRHFTLRMGTVCGNSIWYSGMRHTGATQTRMTRDAHTRCHTNMVNNKREIYNKLPASRAGRKRHFRRYPPPPPAVVILPRTLGRAAAWGAAGGSSRGGEAVFEASRDARALAHGLSHLGLLLVGARARSRATVERELAIHTHLPPTPSFPFLPLACPL